MDELQGIAEIIQGLSGDAQVALKWWLMYKVFHVATTALAVSGVVLTIAVMGYRLIRRGIETSADLQFDREVARAAGMYAPLNHVEKSRILSKVQELLPKTKE